MESMQVLDSNVYRQEVCKQVKEMVAFVEQAVEARSAVHELERGLWERMLALGYGCLKLFFSLCGDGDEGETLVLPEGRVLQRLAERHGRPYQSVFGPFELARVVYGTREGQKIEAVPLDERLRLPASQVLLLVARVDAVEHRAVALCADAGAVGAHPASSARGAQPGAHASRMGQRCGAVLGRRARRGARGVQRRGQRGADSRHRARSGRGANARKRRPATGAQEDRLGRQRLHGDAFHAHARRGVQEPV